jgi:hypothetical protein
MLSNLFWFFLIITSVTCSSYKESIANKEFWEIIQLKAILDPVSSSDVFEGDSICVSCPITKDIYLKLYETALHASNTGPLYESLLNPNLNRDPPKSLPILWSLENKKVLCDNNFKVQNDFSKENYKNSPVSKFEPKPDYQCRNNKLCLTNVKIGLPEKYTCHIGGLSLKSNINIRGKKIIIFILRF